jgi:hypothetical protein
MNGAATDPRMALIVDGHSTGTFLVREFGDRGVPCVHLQTGEYGAQQLLDDHRYLAQLTYGDDLEAVLARLSRYPIGWVVPGLEGDGVSIAEKLAAALGLPGNDPATSAIRRDKAQMADALAAAGLRHIPHRVSESPADLLAAWRGWGHPPVVVKPPASAGSEDVRPCTTAHQIVTAAERIIGKVNALEQVNPAAMIQPHVRGDEFVVNAVSADGSHCVTDVWWCLKEPGPLGAPLDVCSDLMTMDDSATGELIAYVHRVLDAVGIGWGASHAEAVWSADGPVLLEVGARLMGGTFDFNALSRSGVYSQIEAVVDACLDPKLFARRRDRGYRPHETVRTADLAPAVSGRVRRVDLGRVRSLESYRMEYLSIGVGDWLAPPIDRNTHVGFVTFAHRDPDVVARDYAMLRAIESEIFDVED